jgi:hypothetical protein
MGLCVLLLHWGTKGARLVFYTKPFRPTLNPQHNLAFINITIERVAPDGLAIMRKLTRNIAAPYDCAFVDVAKKTKL